LKVLLHLDQLLCLVGVEGLELGEDEPVNVLRVLRGLALPAPILRNQLRVVLGLRLTMTLHGWRTCILPVTTHPFILTFFRISIFKREKNTFSPVFIVNKANFFHLLPLSAGRRMPGLNSGPLQS
jgi:hypothetical protein